MLHAAGPSTADEALRWAREALGNGRYWVVDHAEARKQQRRISVADMKSIIKRATACEAYPDGTPRFGGTCWRMTGPSLDEIETALGVEVYVDHLGKRLVVVTVF
jgi:hypothetical protein